MMLAENSAQRVEHLVRKVLVRPEQQSHRSRAGRQKQAGLWSHLPIPRDMQRRRTASPASVRHQTARVFWGPRFYCFIIWLRLSLQRVSPVPQQVKNPPAVLEIWVRSLRREELLEEQVATHSSIPAWEIPWTEEPGGLQSMGVGKSWTRLSDWALTSLQNQCFDFLAFE